jgi:protein-tyrosine-phosphatase
MHTSQRLRGAHVRSASLVLGMARGDLSGALAMVPSAQARSFTLLEASRLASRLMTDGLVAPAHLSEVDRLTWWVESLDLVRRKCPQGDPAEDDLPDPHESSLGHEVVLPQLAAAIHTLVTVLAPASTPLG